ncbi:MAG: hypothetical protein DHS20C18_16420 [Saprospiraceae bacterium]|nr:MAG: hypothetical protein DHS20C18_16420 [Saprospiraceae bacterium]
MINQLKNLFFFFSIFFFFSCQEEKVTASFADCKYAQPEAIFESKTNLIKSHDFLLEGQKGIELITFSDGVKLKLIQEGCDDLLQTFEFSFPQLNIQEDTPNFWLMLAVAQFDRIADIGPNYMVFGSWAAALVRYRDQFSFGNSVQLQKGFFAKLERLEGRNGGILMLTLSQKP